MNVNAEKGKLVQLQRAYIDCLTVKANQWLKETEPSKEVEFCVTEKSAYLEQMRVNVPLEYDNIMRIEQNNF